MAEKTLEEQINELAAKFAPVFEKFAELSVAQTVLLLEQAQMSGKLTQPLTQVDIQAFSQYKPDGGRHSPDHAGRENQPWTAGGG